MDLNLHFNRGASSLEILRFAQDDNRFVILVSPTPILLVILRLSGEDSRRISTCTSTEATLRLRSFASLRMTTVS
jgi:hypothetical protein